MRKIHILFAFLAVMIGSAATAFAQGQSAPAQGAAKPKAAPEAYRQLDPVKDGLTFKMSGMSMSFTNGGRTMVGTIDLITFTSTSGQELNIEHVSVAENQIHTAEFGTMRMKVPDATTPGVLLFVTNSQVRQIKKKMDAAASK